MEKQRERENMGRRLGHMGGLGHMHGDMDMGRQTCEEYMRSVTIFSVLYYTTVDLLELVSILHLSSCNMIP